MTVVVFRDGVIASDSGMSSGGHRTGSVGKIFLGPGLVGGASGVLTRCHAWGRWIEAGGPIRGEFRQDPPGEGDWNAFSVDARGGLRHYDNDGWFDLSKVPYYAIGSGKLVALGALHQGATAAQAVAAAIHHCEGVSGPIRTVDVRTRHDRCDWSGVVQHG